jgi:hypothetical protein
MLRQILAGIWHAELTRNFLKDHLGLNSSSDKKISKDGGMPIRPRRTPPPAGPAWPPLKFHPLAPAELFNIAVEVGAGK